MCKLIVMYASNNSHITQFLSTFTVQSVITSRITAIWLIIFPLKLNHLKLLFDCIAYLSKTLIKIKCH